MRYHTTLHFIFHHTLHAVLSFYEKACSTFCWKRVCVQSDKRQSGRLVNRDVVASKLKANSDPSNRIHMASSHTGPACAMRRAANIILPPFLFRYRICFLFIFWKKSQLHDIFWSMCFARRAMQLRGRLVALPERLREQLLPIANQTRLCRSASSKKHRTSR